MKSQKKYVVRKSQPEPESQPMKKYIIRKQKRVYLKEGEDAPEGVDVKEGARGGRYYDVPGGVAERKPPEKKPTKPVHKPKKPKEYNEYSINLNMSKWKNKPEGF